MTAVSTILDATSPTSRHVFGTLEVIQVMVPTLGNAWYVAASTETREAVTIDAPRDPDILAPLAREHGWSIIAALDTHIHNDFLSGGPELVAAGTTATFHQPHPPASSILPTPGVMTLLPCTLGSIQIAACATPGHTPEHVSYCLMAADSTPVCIFSGGALMNGAIARPDLLGPHETIRLSLAARESLAALLAFPRTVPVFPTHHGGSFCAAAASQETSTTVGEQQQGNPLARAASWDTFLALHTLQGEYPSYFSRMGELNRSSSYSPDHREQPSECSPSVLADPSCIPIDLRPPRAFMAHHAAGALNIGYSTSFTAWAGWLLDPDSPSVLIAEDARAASYAHQDLYRIGYEQVMGWIPERSISDATVPHASIPVIADFAASSSSAGTGVATRE